MSIQGAIVGESSDQAEVNIVLTSYGCMWARAIHAIDLSAVPTALVYSVRCVRIRLNINQFSGRHSGCHFRFLS